jgi:hypothetical protein
VPTSESGPALTTGCWNMQSNKHTTEQIAGQLNMKQNH